MRRKQLVDDAENNGIAVDIHSFYLHVYPIAIFLVLVTATSVVILADRNSYAPPVFVLLAIVTLVSLQAFLINEKDATRLTTRCINAVSAFWLLWVVYATMWPMSAVFTSAGGGASNTVFYFVSSLQCFLGIEAHIRHTVNDRRDQSAQLQIFEQETPITRRMFGQILTGFYVFLFVFFPTQGSDLLLMHPIEAFIRPLLMFILACATVAIHTCTNIKTDPTLLLREVSWICLCNVFCLVFLLYQGISLGLKASNCFSFLGTKMQIGAPSAASTDTAPQYEFQATQKKPTYTFAQELPPPTPSELAKLTLTTKITSTVPKQLRFKNARHQPRQPRFNNQLTKPSLQTIMLHTQKNLQNV